jgi:hypothetical protein
MRQLSSDRESAPRVLIRSSITRRRFLSRIEIDAMLVEVLSRLEDVERTAPPEWLASNFISGPRTMPVRFRAGRKVGVG